MAASSTTPCTTAASHHQDTATVVHVRADSDSYLEALFNHLVDPAANPRQRNLPPLRQRNLPQSFFSQAPGGGHPNAGHHSRENSNDSGYTTTGNGSQSLRVGVHARSHSMPGSLPQTSHRRTASNEALQSFTQAPTSSPSNINRTLALPGHQIVEVDDALGELPPNWAMARLANGQKYFINHATKATTWQDPRISRISLPSSSPSASAPSAPAAMPTTPNQNSPVVAAAGNANTQSLPEGWEQAVTNDGLTYYINHHDKSTTWTDPRTLPGAVGQASGGSLANHRASRLAGMPNGGAATTTLPVMSPAYSQIQSRQQFQQRIKIQRLQQERAMMKLQREREMLMKQHHELLQYEMKLKSYLAEDSPGASVHARDPLMSSAYHSRESSADYSMGRSTPSGPSGYIGRQGGGAAGGGHDTSLLDSFEELGITDPESVDPSGHNLSPALATQTAQAHPMQYNPSVQVPGGMLQELLDSMDGTNVDDGSPRMHPGSDMGQAMETEETLSPELLSDVQSLLSTANDASLFQPEAF